MPFSATRDLWLLLKARNEATNAMRAFSRDIRLVGDSVAEANLRAARSALINEMATKRLAAAYQISILRQGEQTDAVRAQIRQIENQTKAELYASQLRLNDIDKEISKMHLQRSVMEENRVAAQKLSSALSGMSAAAAAVGTITVAAAAFGAVGLKKLIDAQVEYEKQSALTRTQVDKFATSLQDVEAIGLRIADAIGVPFEQIQPALYNIFSSMEVGAAQAEKLLGTFAKAAVAGQTSIENASTATIGILNAFQLPLKSVNHLMDVQFQLVKEGIGTYDEWSQRIGLVTPSAVRFGQSVDMMAAALAASTRMGISAARSATAVSRAMDAMSNPQAVKNMKALGVEAYDASGKFRPMIDIMKDFRAKLMALPNKERIKTLLDVFKGAGGTIEARRFLQNMLLTPGNLELFQNILGSMQKSAGSFEEAYSIMADTTATKSELMANKWEEVKIAAGKTLVPIFTTIIDKVTQLLNWFNKLSPGTQAIIVKIMAWGVALMGVVGIFLLLTSVGLAFAAAMVVVEGSVLAIIAIVSAAIIVLAGLGVAFAVLMAKSKNFRDHVAEVWQWIKDLASAIRDILVKAFHFLGEAIEKYAAPAFRKLINFYRDHKEEIKQAIHYIKILVDWIMKFGAIVLAVAIVIGGGGLVAAFLLLFATITLVIFIILKLIQFFKFLVNWAKTEIPKAWQAVKNFTVKIWNEIINFFKDAWNTIVSFFKDAWNTLSNAFQTGISYIQKIWDYFWGTHLGYLILSILKFLYQLVRVIFLTLLFIFEWGIKGLMMLWNFLWDGIVAGAKAVWNFLLPWLKAAWLLLQAVASTVWNGIQTAIITPIKIAVEFVVGQWKAAVDRLKGIWDAITAIFQTVWTNVANVVGPILKLVVQTVKNYVQSILDFFKDAGKWLVHAGEQLIQGLIDGIGNMFTALGNKLSDLGDFIKSHLPFSPAKRGPLAGRGNPYYSGQSIIKLLAKGMESRKPILSDAITGVLASMINATGGLSTAGVGSTNVQNTGSTYNQNITINTNQISPQRHAAELGWMLMGRSG